MPSPTKELKIAAAVLTLLAAGATLETLVTRLPAFKEQIEEACDSMKSRAKCTSAGIVRLAQNLGEMLRSKYQAMERQDFASAADLRAQECALFESVGLSAPTGETWHAVLFVGMEEQIQHLSALLRQTETGECEPTALPNGDPPERLGNSGAIAGPPSVS